MQEAGVRLGQASDFALVIAVAASKGGQLSPSIAQPVQLARLLTMLISSCVVVLKYSTPIGLHPDLQRA